MDPDQMIRQGNVVLGLSVCLYSFWSLKTKAMPLIFVSKQGTLFMFGMTIPSQLLKYVRMKIAMLSVFWPWSHDLDIPCRAVVSLTHILVLLLFWFFPRYSSCHCCHLYSAPKSCNISHDIFLLNDLWPWPSQWPS